MVVRLAILHGRVFPCLSSPSFCTREVARGLMIQALASIGMNTHADPR